MTTLNEDVNYNRVARHNTPTILTEEDIRIVVSRKLGNQRFRLLSWNVSSFNKGYGFLGAYFNVTAMVSVEDNANVEELRFFAKTPPPPESTLGTFLERCDGFNKEINVYDELIPHMGVGSGGKWYVDCYFCKKDRIIVMEDITVLGYVMPDKYKPLDFQHTALMLKAIARLHSRSLILDERLHLNGQSIWNLYGEKLGEVIFRKDNSALRMLDATLMGINRIIEEVGRIKEFNSHEVDVLKKRVKTWSYKMSHLLSPSAKYRNVICHRDIWANNLMFKYGADGNPQGCCLIDFQLFRYSPPAIDVELSLHVNTDRRTRDEYYDNFIRIYYTELTEALAEEGLDEKHCLPWEIFKETRQFAKNVALVFTLLCLPIMLIGSGELKSCFDGPPEVLEDFIYRSGKANLMSYQFATIKPYQERMIECVLEVWQRLPDEPFLLPNLHQQ
ncbi:uncharacterized protein LOC105696161 [Orussus abietinus]|uniref:uncharacterized protein LOC105696161 n=1 Tax=Orussus abietinus TaxID=222816 RepID=UPI000C7160FA|nr:uncharacterized protein LOC105696161 [Orussus abietinus]